MPAVPTLAASARLGSLLLICCSTSRIFRSPPTGRAALKSPVVTEHHESSLPRESGVETPDLGMDPEEEERAFILEMMKESQRTTARIIERLYGPIEMSE